MIETATQINYNEAFITSAHEAASSPLIEANIIRGRTVDFASKFLPDTLSHVDEIDFLDAAERRQLSHVQGRTFINMLGLFGHITNDKVCALSRGHYADNPAVTSILRRFSDDELRHQRLFRRIDRLIAAGMPGGYRFVTQASALRSVVLSRSSWAVLGLMFHTELATQAHYKQSIFCDPDVSPLFKDVFRFHWREEARHTIVDGIEWARADASLVPLQRDHATDELIGLFWSIDQVLQAQAQADVSYFLAINPRAIGAARRERLIDAVLGAYRWQHIHAGIDVSRFSNTLDGFTTAEQMKRFRRSMSSIAEVPVLH